MGFTLCTMACHPLGPESTNCTGPATKCQLKCELKRELRVGTSLLPTGRVPTKASHQVSAQAWAIRAATYTPLDGILGYVVHNGAPPAGRVPTEASHQVSAQAWAIAHATRPSQQCHPPGAAHRIARLSYYELTGCATATRWARGQHCAQMGRITWNAR